MTPLPSPLRRPELEPLWAEAHRRLSSGRPVSALQVEMPTLDQRHAVADLLGLPRRPPSPYRVRMSTLDAILVDAVGLDTRAVVSELLGPLDDEAARRAADGAAREELWGWVRAHPVVTAQPALEDWVSGLRIVDTSPDATRTLLGRALDVLANLPAPGRPRAALAEDVLDDPHALDDDTRLATLVMRALAMIHDEDPPSTAAARHRLWERSGVSGDQLSVSVLAAGLRPAGDDLVAGILNACAAAGQAAALTLAQLRATARLDLDVDTVWAVENPTVLALAVDRFGTRCPPVVCTSGWPNGAAVTFLRLLTDARVTVLYHGDLDGEGVRIAAHLSTTTGLTPWRMSNRDYRDAARDRGPGVGRVTEAPWDPDLAPAMRERCVAVFEEQVATALLDEMTLHVPPPEPTPG